MDLSNPALPHVQYPEFAFPFDAHPKNSAEDTTATGTQSGHRTNADADTKKDR